MPIVSIFELPGILSGWLSRIVTRPEIVTLVVGPGQVKVKCHKALLGLKSEYFDAICYGGFATTDAPEIEVQEEYPEVMCMFFNNYKEESLRARDY